MRNSDKFHEFPTQQRFLPVGTFVGRGPTTNRKDQAPEESTGDELRRLHAPVDRTCAAPLVVDVGLPRSGTTSWSEFHSAPLYYRDPFHRAPLYYRDPFHSAPLYFMEISQSAPVF